MNQEKQKELDRQLSNENYENLTDLLDIYRLKGSTTSKTEMSGYDEFGEIDLVIETRVVLMTPTLAKQILDECNVDNRPHSSVNVEKLSNEMKNGNWMFNGDTITFDYKGKQKNGQHRLLACIKSGLSFPIIVVTGVQPESFMTMDTGRKRNGGDTMAVMGVKNYTNTASTIKAVHAFKNGRYGENQTSLISALSNSEVAEKYISYNTETPYSKAPLEDSVKYGLKMSKRDECLLKCSITSTFHYLLMEVDPIKGKEFMDQVCLGYGIYKDSPILIVRTRLLKSKTDKNYKLEQNELFRILVYAWQKFKNNEKCKSIRLPENMDMTL